MKNLYKGFGIALLSAFLFTPFLSFAATNEGVATASEVLVVYNSAYTTDSNSDSVQDSLELANYYKSKRSIPDANVVGIDTPTTLAITRSDYNTYIKEPLEKYLTDNNLKDKIKYISFVKGIPLKVYATSGAANNYVDARGDHSSVDSSTTLLFQVGNYNVSWSGGPGPLPNPYFDADPNLNLDNRFKTAHFTNGFSLQYLVTRLDGYTVSDVKNMIDRGVNTDKSGTGYFVLDKYNMLNNQIFDYMATASNNLKQLGKNVYPDPFTTGSTATTSINGKVMGYTGYGVHAGLPTNYYNNSLGFDYLKGAVASTYESYTSFTLTEPDNTGHGQIAQFIRAGGSGGVGSVYEPYSLGIAREDIIYAAYSAGYTWADSAYMSMSVIDWVNVVYGDPLMRIVDDSISVPTVSTNSATNVGEGVATLNATLSATGGENNFKQGFEYGPTTSYGTRIQSTGSFGTGDFSQNISGLACNTTYYYRAYSVNSFKSGYGSQASFTTSACTKPEVRTDNTSNITSSSAKFNATLSGVGTSSVTERGFHYGTTNSFGLSVKENSTAFNTGAFELDINNLSCNTLYFVRAYAVNSSGTSYGTTSSFTTTNVCTPAVNTVTPNDVLAKSSTLVGQIASINGSTVSQRGFEYGTTNSFGNTVNENGNFFGSLEYISKFGSSGGADGQFNDVRATAIDSNGNIYVADRLNHRIQKFDKDGNFITKWGSFGSNNGQFKYPRGVAVDANGNLYVADSDNYRIQKFDSSGTYITKWGGYGTSNGKLSYPQDVVIDSQGNVWVSDYDNNRIQKFSPSGTYLAKFGSYGSGDSQFAPAYALALDSGDNIYVADKNNNRVQKFNSSGTFIMKFGGYGTADGKMILPSGIAIDNSGNIYISDAGNHRIQKFDANGNFVAKMGGMGNTDGKFNNPQDLTIDKNGDLLVADMNNNRIQKISLNGGFEQGITNLACGTTYYYRAYAVNTSGTGYGNTNSFTTLDCAPTVTTGNTLNITGGSARLSGTIVDLGSPTPTLRGFNYGLDTNYGSNTYNNPEKGSIPAGLYYANLKNLNCGTTYNYRAYTTNSVGTSYGDNKTFTTSACSGSAPTIPGTPTTTTPTKDTTPTFTWTASSSANGLNSTAPYSIEISKDNTFATGVTNATSTTNNYTPSTLNDGTYYVRVKAKDSQGQTSDFSNVGTVIIDNVAPPIPDNIAGTSPTNDTTPTITWDSVNDDATGGSGMHASAPYSIVYAKDTNFSVNKNIVNITTNSFTPASPLATGKWYFHVRSRDKAVNPSEYGATLEIEIQ